jgi:hypothetical protein
MTHDQRSRPSRISTLSGSRQRTGNGSANARARANDSGLSDRVRANPLNLGKVGYSASTLYCMTTSLSQVGAGIGTCMGPHKAEELAHEAGFRSIRRLPLDDPFTIVYEARP